MVIHPDMIPRMSPEDAAKFDRRAAWTVTLLAAVLVGSIILAIATR